MTPLLPHGPPVIHTGMLLVVVNAENPYVRTLVIYSFLFSFLFVLPVYSAEVNLFTFSSYPSNPNGNGGAVIDFSPATPAGTFYAPNMDFGANWQPNGLQNLFGADIYANINVSTAGTYTFSTASDDGSLLFIDGNLVVNNNFFQGDTRRTGSIDLTAGNHLVEVQYFQGYGGHDLDVPLPSGITYVDPATEVPLNIYSAPASPGLTYPAVNSSDTFIGTIPTVNVEFGLPSSSWSPFSLHNSFLADMRGYFDVATSGMYDFSTGSDDGSWLAIDGSMVVNNAFYQGYTIRSGSVYLTAGLHPFDLQYFQGGGGAALSMGIPAGVTMAPLPEPGTFVLMGLGLAAAIGRRIRRRAYFSK
jgi:hypothetical protein